jgi:hypothetical protein
MLVNSGPLEIFLQRCPSILPWRSPIGRQKASAAIERLPAGLKKEIRKGRKVSMIPSVQRFEVSGLVRSPIHIDRTLGMELSAKRRRQEQATYATIPIAKGMNSLKANMLKGQQTRYLQLMTIFGCLVFQPMR